MKPHRAFGLLTAVTVLSACAGAWLTPQHPPAASTALDGLLGAPAVFSVR